jgi:hypothetical protein
MMARGIVKRVYYDTTEDGAFGLMPTEGPEYVYKEFPKWKYHAELDPRIVKNKAGEDKLGKAWSDTPIRDKDCDRRPDGNEE